MTNFNIFTIFPEMFNSVLQTSILKRAQDRNIIHVALHNIREEATNSYGSIDDYPYGGGAGMVMKPEPIFTSIEKFHKKGPVIFLSPRGQKFTQKKARELAKEQDISLLCGHYEGIDERIIQYLVTEQISVGDYILTGGELPAMILLDAVSRLLPGVLGTTESLMEESFEDGMLEYPQYTRPPVFRNWMVPEVLLSGNHKKIAAWKKRESLRITKENRPDLYNAAIDIENE